MPRVYDPERIREPTPTLNIEQWPGVGEIGRILLTVSVLRLEQQHDLWRQVRNPGRVALDHVGDGPSNRWVTATDPLVAFPRLPKDIQPPALVYGVPSPGLMQLRGRIIEWPDTPGFARQPSGAKPGELRQSRSDGVEACACDDDLEVFVSP